MRGRLLRNRAVGVLAVLLVLFMTVGHAEEETADAFADMYTMEGRWIGRMSGVVQTPEGTLITAYTDSTPGAWVVFLDRHGNEVWSFAEGDENRYCLYRRPAALPNGDFAVFRWEADGGSEGVSESMVVFDRNGRMTGNHPLPSLPYTHMLVAGDNVFMLGNQKTRDEESGYEIDGLPYLARLNSKAELLWLLEYPHDYANQWFVKAAYGMDSLIIGAVAGESRYEAERGLLYRTDLDGNVLWTVEFEPEIGDEYHIVDVCVNEDGIIAAIVAEYGYNDDYGYNVDRLCSVIGLNMNGEILWQHTLNDGEFRIDRIVYDGVMADHIVPVKDGFLCGGYRISREDSGLLPIEWVRLLDREGNVMAKDSTPDIRDDRVEVHGMASGMDGKALLYGANIEGVEILEGWEEGDIPGKPFYAVLDFPDTRYALAPSATAGTADELLIQQIDEYFTLSRDEIIEKLGPDYTVVPAGPEGACDGYYYEDLGMAFAFYPDSPTPELIDCYPEFKIHGVGVGSCFSEILEALGDTEIVETWLELPIYTVFMVQYRLGSAAYSFIAFDEGEPVQLLWIHRMP